jgi:hypothetical protein
MNPETRKEATEPTEAIPIELRVRILDLEKCWGDIEGRSPKCDVCPVRKECLKKSLGNVLKLHEMGIRY